MQNSGVRVARSAFFMLLLKLFQRGLGLVSTLILARILIPEDFGIVAIVTMVGLFFNILTQTGSEQYILQKQSVDETDLNAALTLDLCTKSLIWLIFIVITPFIAKYYEENDLATALWASSIILPLGALLSPKFYLLKKEQNFGKVTLLEGGRKLFSFCIMMIVLIFEQSYWVVVIGDIASITFLVIGSYFIAPHKPKLCATRIVEQWAFSKWMLLKGIFGFVRSQADLFLVSRSFGLDDVGRYHMAKHIAYIPANDIIIPTTEPLISAFSSVKHDKPQLTFRVMVGLLAVSFITFPTTLFTAFFPDLIVDCLLGEKWVETYGIVTALGFAVMLASFGHFCETTMISIGQVKSIFIYDVCSMVTLLSFLWFFPGETIVNFTEHRTFILLVIIIPMLLMVIYFIRLPVFRVIKLIIPVLVSTAMSAITIQYIKHTSFTEILGPTLSFILLGSLYVTMIICVLCLIYRTRAYTNDQELYIFWKVLDTVKTKTMFWVKAH